jgi:hypothetical protein
MNPIRPVAALSSLLTTAAVFHGVAALARPAHFAAQPQKSAQARPSDLMARAYTATAIFAF